MRFPPRILFTVGVVILSAYAVISSRDWPLTMSLFPLIVGGPVLVLSLIQLGMELYHLRSADGTRREDTGDLQVDLNMDTGVVAAKAGKFFGWILGFFFCVWLLGFFVAVPLYTLLYLKLDAKENWKLSIALTMATFIFFVGLFDQILHLPWTEPLIAAPEEFIRNWTPEFAVFDSSSD